MAIYMWREYTIPTESIVYKMNADSNGNLYVPVGWYSHSASSYWSYDWNISIDWWASTNYSWTWSSWWSITLSWYTAWSSHTIAITPTTETYWWALAYWWYNTAWATYLTEVVYDWSYMWYWESATSTGKYFRFCQYYQCTSLTSAPEEVLPDTVTSIWAYFRGFQYYWCTSLTEIKWWKDLSIGGSYYRREEFNWCTANKTVKVLSDVWYASYAANTLENSYVTSVSVPSAYLSNFTWASVQPRSSIDDSKFIWY